MEDRIRDAITSKIQKILESTEKYVKNRYQSEELCSAFLVVVRNIGESRKEIISKCLELDFFQDARFEKMTERERMFEIDSIITHLEMLNLVVITTTLKLASGNTIRDERGFILVPKSVAKDIGLDVSNLPNK